MTENLKSENAIDIFTRASSGTFPHNNDRKVVSTSDEAVFIKRRCTIFMYGSAWRNVRYCHDQRMKIRYVTSTSAVRLPDHLGGGGGGKIYCYTNLFCYANFSSVFGPNFSWGTPCPHPHGRKLVVFLVTQMLFSPSFTMQEPEVSQGIDMRTSTKCLHD